MSQNKNQRRIDLLVGTKESHPAVHKLGSEALHGPKKEEHIVVVLGVGPGVGLAVARQFANYGYTTAILSRNKDRLDAWAKELDHTIQGVRETKESTAQSLAFSCDVMSNESIKKAIAEIEAAWPDKKIGTAVYNASVRNRNPFLDQRQKQIEDAVQASIFGGFTFMQTIVKSMAERNNGEGGTIIVTGATSSTRGREGFAGFAASKSGLRAICQSVAREYGPKNIHVAHVIIDGLIESQQAIDHFGMEKGSRFPDGSALRPEELCKAYLFLALQHKSAWTFELDMRPAKEYF